MTARVPKKHLGQNFLVDPNIKNKIIAACHLQKDDIVLEIGPGPGALTRIIVAQVKTLYAVETDAGFCEDLKRDPDLGAVKVIHGDILKYDLKSLPPGTTVIGNLPYYISSPIIERLIGHRSIFPQCFLTVQWEFGRRLTAQPHTKDYGSLSCFAQYYGDVKILFKIPPAAFRPAPRVVSCFVAITFREPQIKAHNEPLLFDIIRTAFQQRRKKISNSLKTFANRETLAEIFEKCRINEGNRAENLSLADYIRITNAFLPSLQTSA